MKTVKLITDIMPGDQIYDRGELVTVHRVEKDIISLTLYHSRGNFTSWNLRAKLLVIEDTIIIDIEGAPDPPGSGWLAGHSGLDCHRPPKPG